MFSPQANFDALICFIYFFRDCRYEKMQQKLLGNWKFSLRNLEVSYHVIEKYMSQFFYAKHVHRFGWRQRLQHAASFPYTITKLTPEMSLTTPEHPQHYRESLISASNPRTNMNYNMQKKSRNFSKRAGRSCNSYRM